MRDRAKIWGVMRDFAYISRFSRDEQVLMIFVIAWLEEKILRDGVIWDPAWGGGGGSSLNQK